MIELYGDNSTCIILEKKFKRLHIPYIKITDKAEILKKREYFNISETPFIVEGLNTYSLLDAITFLNSKR